jgi:hypothetical protein
MTENIDEEHLENPTDNQSENRPDNVVLIKDAETITQNQETENMEVQKHPHHVTHKKKWGEYLLEFFMLFLAVTLGFFAENLREEIKHKEEVKTQMHSLLSDLQTDISLLESGLERNNYSSKMADSLIELLHSDISNTADIYVAARTVTANLGYTYTNSKSFDQMKSSGLLRYIKPNYLLDSIGSYYVSFQWLTNQTDLLRLKMDEIHKKNALLFDSYVFQQMIQNGIENGSNRRTIVNKPAVKPALLSTNANDINTVSLNYHYYSSTIKFFINKSVEQQDRAIRLVELIKKDYPLE